jgi:hypothetical protein
MRRAAQARQRVDETSACDAAIERLLEDRALADTFDAVRREAVREQLCPPRLMRPPPRVLERLGVAPLAARCEHARRQHNEYGPAALTYFTATNGCAGTRSTIASSRGISLVCNRPPTPAT